MSFDFKAVADALAVRFGPTITTPPSGENPIVLATSSLPDAIVGEPTLLVYPVTSVALNYAAGTRSGVATFPVRFYIYPVRDNPRNADLMNNWTTALYSALDGQVHLGLSTYVTHAVVKNVVIGPLAYGDPEVQYHGIELTVEVHLWEALSATA